MIQVRGVLNERVHPVTDVIRDLRVHLVTDSLRDYLPVCYRCEVCKMNVPHRILTPDEPSKSLGKTLERDSSVDCNFLAPAVAFADVCTRLSLYPNTV